MNLQANIYTALLVSILLTTGIDFVAAQTRSCKSDEKQCWASDGKYCCLKTKICGNKKGECLDESSGDSGGSQKDYDIIKKQLRDIGKSQDKIELQ
jgi:hypothetical protein